MAGGEVAANAHELALLLADKVLIELSGTASSHSGRDGWSASETEVKRWLDGISVKTCEKRFVAASEAITFVEAHSLQTLAALLRREFYKATRTTEALDERGHAYLA